MLKLSLSFMLLINLQGFSVSAQKKLLVPPDNSMVSIRSFNNKAIAGYKSDKEFNYGELRDDLSPSLWDQFWSWVWDLFNGAISGAKSEGVLKYLFIGLGCCVVIFLIVKFLGMDSGQLFSGKSKQVEIPYQENLENIHEISFEQAVANALLNHDFKLAVRLLYLQSLKKLNDTGKIHWDTNKTNSAYINELENPSLKKEFRVLTQRFEYVWYGSFNLDKEVYTKISRSFADFNVNKG